MTIGTEVGKRSKGRYMDQTSDISNNSFFFKILQSNPLLMFNNLKELTLQMTSK